LFLLFILVDLSYHFLFDFSITLLFLSICYIDNGSRKAATVGLPPPAQAGGGSPKNPLYAGFFVEFERVVFSLKIG